MFLFGLKKHKLDYISFEHTCSKCKEFCDHQLIHYSSYFSMYFIPTFPLGKGAMSVCSNCGCNIKKKDKHFPEGASVIYEGTKVLYKTPRWHWIGSIIFTVLIAVFAFILLNSTPDKREPFLASDMDKMVAIPTIQTDSIAYKIKQTIDQINSSTERKKYSYKTYQTEEKALILVKIPDFGNATKDARIHILQTIEKVLNQQTDLEEKSLYIGLEGNYGFKIIKTPTEFKNGKYIGNKALLDFYAKE